MNKDVDDQLQALFSAADKPLPSDQFVAQMMKQIEPRPVYKFFRLLMIVLLLGGAWVVATAVNSLTSVMTGLISAPILSAPIMELGDSTLATYLAPLNSALPLMALTGLGIWWMWRRFSLL